MAKSIMVQGTGSGVGKSVITAALCRIFLQDGRRVAPYKAQNMALNSFVTDDGGEIGRAQAFQAKACGLKPTVDMNPVLLKPTTDIGAQVIVRGRSVGNFSAKLYTRYKKRITDIVDESFRRLAKEYEIIVIEGAGSPAEVNLKSHDIVNMRASRIADAPVILVGDIDKGGVFAWLIGTIKLLDRKERKRIKGFIINKFRGDIDLLRPGIKFLENKTGIKVLGVVPYFKGINIPEEDGIYRREKIGQGKKNWLNIGVIKLPHISNHTDFDIFERERVNLSYIERPVELEKAAIVIIPGTKNTVEDLAWLKKTGLAKKILSTLNSNPSTTLVGICGGFQMLGKRILDPLRVESRQKSITGFKFFEFDTVFEAVKVTKQVEAGCIKNGFKVGGYEIHHGRTIWDSGHGKPMFIIKKRGGERVKIYDGAYTRNFQIWGTQIHGIFDNYLFRKWFLDFARKKTGLPAQSAHSNLKADQDIDALAGLVRKNLDMRYLYKVLNKNV